MNNPCQVPISFYAGETFVPPPISWIDVNGNPVNISGFSATMMARVTTNSLNPPEILASTGNGLITVNGTMGTIQINISSTVTGTLSPFCGVWDLFVYSPAGVATRLVGGNINILEPVTR